MSKHKTCLTCNHCIPIGEGDHICDLFDMPIIVIDNYEPTEDFNKCEGKGWIA